METKYYSLGPSETGITVRIIRTLFGLVCLAIAIFWMIYNLKSVRSDRILWVTVSFLTGFGLYQVWAGFGRTARFIQIGSDRIVLRKNSLLPRIVMISSKIRRIEIYPLSLIFYSSDKGRTILRFGTVYADRIDPVKSDIQEFASINNIDFEEISEEI